MISLIAATFLWFCGPSGLCLDLEGADIHYPSITTAARLNDGQVVPVILDCRRNKIFFLANGLSGELAEQKFERGTLFSTFCERAFGEEM